MEVWAYEYSSGLIGIMSCVSMCCQSALGVVEVYVSIGNSDTVVVLFL